MKALAYHNISLITVSHPSSRTIETHNGNGRSSDFATFLQASSQVFLKALLTSSIFLKRSASYITQWHLLVRQYPLTAAGLFRILTCFPFNLCYKNQLRLQIYKKIFNHNTSIFKFHMLSLFPISLDSFHKVNWIACQHRSNRTENIVILSHCFKKLEMTA